MPAIAALMHSIALQKPDRHAGEAIHRQATAASYLFVQQSLVYSQQQLTLKVSWGQSVSSGGQNLTT